MIEKGITQFAKVKTHEVLGGKFDYEITSGEKRLEFYDSAKDPKEVSISEKKEIITDPKLVQSSTEAGRNHDDKVAITQTKFSSVKEKIEKIAKLDKEIPNICLSDKDKQILRKLELEHEKKIQKEGPSIEKNVSEAKQAHVDVNFRSQKNPINSASSTENKPLNLTIKPSIKPRQTVSY